MHQMLPAVMQGEVIRFRPFIHQKHRKLASAPGNPVQARPRRAVKSPMTVLCCTVCAAAWVRLGKDVMRKAERDDRLPTAARRQAGNRLAGAGCPPPLYFVQAGTFFIFGNAADFLRMAFPRRYIKSIRMAKAIRMPGCSINGSNTAHGRVLPATVSGRNGQVTIRPEWA